MKKIIMKKFGTSLVSRAHAEQIFFKASENQFKIEFDFTGVEFISSSFADELFVKGKESFGLVFKISNLESSFLKLIIKQSFITREKFTNVV